MDHELNLDGTGFLYCLKCGVDVGVESFLGGMQSSGACWGSGRCGTVAGRVYFKGLGCVAVFVVS